MSIHIKVICDRCGINIFETILSGYKNHEYHTAAKHGQYVYRNSNYSICQKCINEANSEIKNIKDKSEKDIKKILKPK